MSDDLFLNMNFDDSYAVLRGVAEEILERHKMDPHLSLAALHTKLLGMPWTPQETAHHFGCINFCQRRLRALLPVVLEGEFSLGKLCPTTKLEQKSGLQEATAWFIQVPADMEIGIRGNQFNIYTKANRFLIISHPGWSLYDPKTKQITLAIDRSLSESPIRFVIGRS